MGEATCVVCRHRTIRAGRVCTPCATRMREQLTGLLRQLAQLHLSLVPAAGPADGPRVTTSRVGSPTTARLDALSLLGPGSDAVYARHLPDQIGELPPAVWLDSWERAWRKVFRTFGGGDPHNPGAGQVTTMDIQLPGPVRLDRAAAATLLRVPGGPAVLAGLLTVGAAWRTQREQLARIAVGRRDGNAGRRPERRGVDPLVDEWLIRFGPAARVPAAQVRHLLRFLDRACEHDDIPIADFAAELRAVTFELGHALDEIDEKTWLGRCPTPVPDGSDGFRPCGGGLWQDPFTGVIYNGASEPDGVRVQCPACHTGWGPSRLDLVLLVGAIRKVWPVDRRRRYRTTDRPTVCRCGGPLDVTWREVTSTEDTARWWQATAATCRACKTEVL